MVTILNLVITLLIFIFILGLIVFVHELGHFIVAKKMGVVVVEFAFGFGKKIWSKKIKETEYRINILPFGGYCKMLGDQDEAGFRSIKYTESEEANKKFAVDWFKKNNINIKTAEYYVIEDFVKKSKKKLDKDDFKKLQRFFQNDYIVNHSGNFNNTSKFKKFLVIIAGVVMNFILGVVLYYIFLPLNSYFIDVVKLGDPKFIGANVANPPIIQFVNNTDNGRVIDIGLITSINGEIITNENQFLTILDDNYNKEVSIQYTSMKEGDQRYKEIKEVINGDGYAGFLDKDLFNFPVISAVKKDSIADNAGLLVGDILLSFQNQKLGNNVQLKSILQQYKGQKINIEILSDDKIKNIVVDIPNEEEPLIGITYFSNTPFAEYIYRIDYSDKKLFSGISQSINMLAYNFSGLGFMFKRSVEEKSVEPMASSVSSIVGITGVVYSLVEVHDFLNILNLTALISLSLAFMNILPIPLFDGGQILFIFVEAIRGKKMSDKTLERISMVTFYVIIAISLLVILKDVLSFGFIKNIIESIK